MTAPKPAPPSSTALAFVAPGDPDAADTIESLRAELAETRRLVLVERAACAHGVREDLVEFLTAETPEALDDQARRLARLNHRTPNPASVPAASAATSPQESK